MILLARFSIPTFTELVVWVRGYDNTLVTKECRINFLFCEIKETRAGANYTCKYLEFLVGGGRHSGTEE